MGIFFFAMFTVLDGAVDSVGLAMTDVVSSLYSVFLIE